jgi:NDP-sugar pyrophosphorylase family protein
VDSVSESGDRSRTAAPVVTFVLAGGLGTRLKSVSGDLPKGLMPVDGKPFLRRLLEKLLGLHLTDVVLCLGYGADAIVTYFTAHPLPLLRLHFSIATEPRGTAGALRVAERYWSEQNLIVNGDTELPFAFEPLSEYHRTMCADLTIGLAHVADVARFGRVQPQPDGRVETFQEKSGVHESGLVNAGAYLATRRALDEIPSNREYSVERDWLPDLLRRGFALYALPVADSLLDIGMPEDYWRLANREVK